MVRTYSNHIGQHLGMRIPKIGMVTRPTSEKAHFLGPSWPLRLARGPTHMGYSSIGREDEAAHLGGELGGSREDPVVSPRLNGEAAVLVLLADMGDVRDSGDLQVVPARTFPRRELPATSSWMFMACILWLKGEKMPQDSKYGMIQNFAKPCWSWVPQAARLLDPFARTSSLLQTTSGNKRNTVRIPSQNGSPFERSKRGWVHAGLCITCSLCIILVRHDFATWGWTPNDTCYVPTGDLWTAHSTPPWGPPGWRRPHHH